MKWEALCATVYLNTLTVDELCAPLGFQVFFKISPDDAEAFGNDVRIIDPLPDIEDGEEEEEEDNDKKEDGDNDDEKEEEEGDKDEYGPTHCFKKWNQQVLLILTSIRVP